MCIDLTVNSLSDWEPSFLAGGCPSRGLQAVPTLTQDFLEGPCYSMRDTVWFINCVSIFYTSCFSYVLPIGPHSAPCSVPMLQGSEMRTQRLAVEVRLEGVSGRNDTVSRPSLRGMVPSCRSGEPQLMIYGPEGSTDSRMAFCKLGRNLNYQKLQHHGLEPCVSGSLLTDQEMTS